jgi:hypothetical protein
MSRCLILAIKRKSSFNNAQVFRPYDVSIIEERMNMFTFLFSTSFCHQNKIKIDEKCVQKSQCFDDFLAKSLDIVLKTMLF